MGAVMWEAWDVGGEVGMLGEREREREGWELEFWWYVFVGETTFYGRMW